MDVDIVGSEGNSIVEDHERGYLVARDSCPSMPKSLWSGDERYIEEYWSTWDGLWDHGDWAQKDEDGFWFLHGRADDALNVAGRKVGPAEIEGVLIDHEAVNQAAAVGVPDETTGTAVVASVVLKDGVDPSDDLRAELRELVGQKHGKPFRPREVSSSKRSPKHGAARSFGGRLRQSTPTANWEICRVSRIQTYWRRSLRGPDQPRTPEAALDPASSHQESYL